jgi:outer membrane usher protein
VARHVATTGAVAVFLNLLSMSPAAAQEQRAFLALTVNQVEKGDVLVVIKGDDIWIGAGALAEAGLQHLEGTRETSDGEERVSLKSLSHDVQFEFDDRALTLRLTVRPDLLGSTRLEVETSTPADLVYSHDSSAFVNYSLNWRGGNELDLFTESGLSLDRMFLASTLSVASGRTPQRGLTSLTIDDQQELRRWVIGDTFASSGPLGGLVLVGGISVFREFAVQPYFIRYPGLSMTGTATTPSTVELYVNDRLVRREEVAPGQFELTNVPLTNGNNDARLIVKDAFGNVREISESHYLTTTTLARGLHDYHYSFGFHRRGGGTVSWGYGAPMFLGRHRTGLTDRLTAGGRLEVGRGLLNGGPIINTRLPFAELEAAVGMSRNDGRWGSTTWLSITQTARRMSWGITVQPSTAKYATVSMIPGGDRTRFETSGFASGQLAGRMSVTVQHSRATTYAGRLQHRSTLLTSARLTRNVDLIASGARSLQDNRRGRQVFVGVTVSMGRNGTATVAHDRVDNNTWAVAEVHRPVPVGKGYGYRLRTQSGDRRFLTGVVEYQGDHGRYEMRHEAIGVQKRTSVSVSGGLVAAGGTFFASRSIQSSFALVRVPGVEGVRTYANHQEVGRTNRKGDLIVPDLLSYYGNLVNIADEDIPLNYEIGRVQTTIAPPHRGGALVTFPVKRLQSTKGIVLIETAGEKVVPVVPAYGKLTVTVGGKPMVSPIGATGEFYFENIPSGRHAAVIEHGTIACEFELEIPKSEAPVITLGTQTCALPRE